MVNIDVSVKNYRFFLIFATFAVSFRLELSAEQEPEIAGPTATATDIGDQNVSSSLDKNSVFFCIPTIAPLLMDQNFALTVYLTDLMSNHCQPTIIVSIVTTFICTSTTFVNAS